MTNANSRYRPEFEAALNALAPVFDRVVALGGARPVIVGGAAVEFYTVSAIRTGVVDLMTAADDVFALAMAEAGFIRPRGPGVLTRGWVHEALDMGVEVVSSSLMEGAAERGRIRLVHLKDGEVAFLAIEDMIADRMGQYHADTTHGDDMIGQARAMFDLAEDLDQHYLTVRIAAETQGACDLDTLLRWKPKLQH